MAAYADAPAPGAAAYADALRLSRAMTYKNALAGLDHGGGKGVILADSRAHKASGDALLHAYGRLVASLDGRLRHRRRRRHDGRRHGRHRRGLPLDDRPLPREGRGRRLRHPHRPRGLPGHAGERPGASSAPTTSPGGASAWSARARSAAASSATSSRPGPTSSPSTRPTPAREAVLDACTRGAVRRHRRTSCWRPSPRCSPPTRWAASSPPTSSPA